MAYNIAIGFGDRLKTLLKDGVSQKTMAAEISVSLSTFQSWLAEKNQPKLEAIARIAELTGADLNWLVMGKAAAQPESRPDFALIKRLDVHASAGSGTLNNEEQQIGSLSFRRDWLRERGINPNAATVISAWGDSMEPTIRSGDTLLVDSSIDRIIDEGIYILVLNGLALVKRLRIHMNGDLTLSSDNPQYGNETVKAKTLNDLTVAGRVMWFGRSI